MGLPHQFDNIGTTYQAVEFNEVWTVRDEDEYRREYCDWLDNLQLDDDGIPY